MLSSEEPQNYQPNNRRRFFPQESALTKAEDEEAEWRIRSSTPRRLKWSNTIKTKKSAQGPGHNTEVAQYPRHQGRQPKTAAHKKRWGAIM